MVKETAVHTCIKCRHEWVGDSYKCPKCGSKEINTINQITLG